MREYHEAIYNEESSEHDPFTIQQPGAVCVTLSDKCQDDGDGRDMWVWWDHTRNRTYSEVRGAVMNAGSFWVEGIVPAQEMAREYEEECLVEPK